MLKNLYLLYDFLKKMLTFYQKHAELFIKIPLFRISCFSQHENT
jgi:hypothetical protein